METNGYVKLIGSIYVARFRLSFAQFERGWLVYSSFTQPRSLCEDLETVYTVLVVWKSLHAHAPRDFGDISPHAAVLSGVLHRVTEASAGY